MTWLSIILWILMNLPEIIAFFRRIFGRANPARKESMRIRLSEIIQSNKLTRAEKRLLVRAHLTAVEHEMLQEETAARGISL